MKDVIGEVHNYNTIIDMLPTKVLGKRREKRVLVRCLCGSEREASYSDIVKNKSKSCGCLSNKYKTQVKEGDTFGYWTVMKELKSDDGRTILCKCFCGKEKHVSLTTLNTGKSKSCGCQGRIKQPKIIREKLIPKDTETEKWRECASFP